jgi:hypothetical protein
MINKKTLMGIATILLTIAVVNRVPTLRDLVYPQAAA